MHLPFLFNMVIFNMNSAENASLPPDMPVCNCGAHVSCSRSRFGMLNDESMWQLFSQAFSEVCNLYCRYFISRAS